MVKMTYSPVGAKGLVALVGKGVVFDSGGLSLKSGSGMETMKTDMGGAAAVIGAMSALKDLGVKTKVVAFTPMVENMPSGTAIRPGDVLKIRNGKTVEVLNTDAEGRLILADGLSLAVEEKPEAIIDLATLTGACVVALGEKIAGLMASNDSWGEQVRSAADRAGEQVWPLPLPDAYNKLIESEIADLKNIGSGGYGGALTAGLFLQAFVGEVPWVHLDIAGPARAGSDDGVYVRGGTGFGVRTLVELLSTYTKPSSQRLQVTRAAVAPARDARDRGRRDGRAVPGRHGRHCIGGRRLLGRHRRDEGQRVPPADVDGGCRRDRALGQRGSEQAQRHPGLRQDGLEERNDQGGWHLRAEARHAGRVRVLLLVPRRAGQGHVRHAHREERRRHDPQGRARAGEARRRDRASRARSGCRRTRSGSSPRSTRRRRARSSSCRPASTRRP